MKNICYDIKIEHRDDDFRVLFSDGGRLSQSFLIFNLMFCVCVCVCVFVCVLYFEYDFA